MQYIAYFSPTCQRDLEHIARALTFLKALIFQKYVWQAISAPRCNQQHYPCLHISLRGKAHFMSACISFTIVWNVAQTGTRARFWGQSKNTSLSLLCPTMLGFFSAKPISMDYLRVAVSASYQGQDTIHTHTLCVGMLFFLNWVFYRLKVGQVQMQMWLFIWSCGPQSEWLTECWCTVPTPSFQPCVAMPQRHPPKLPKHYTPQRVSQYGDGWCICDLTQVPGAAVLQAGVTSSGSLSLSQAHCIAVPPPWAIPLQPSPAPYTFDITLCM